ncbi:hypothetical protein LTR65_003620 [Meristemomyces frigidus]
MLSSHTLAFANRRPPAKTHKVGFLHLTDEVRKKIYELAIYDHDRDAVFLPRALPRKVGPKTDIDVTHVYDDDVLPVEKYFVVYPTGVDSSHSAGRFTTGTFLYVEQSVEQDSNDSSMQMSSDAGGPSSESDSVLAFDLMSCPSTTSEPNDQFTTDNHELVASDTISDEDSDQTSVSQVASTDEDFEARPGEDTDSESVVLVNGGKHGWVPSACLDNTCHDQQCKHCAGCGIGREQDQSAYFDGDDPFFDRTPHTE